MSIVGIVSLSILAALFLFLLLGGVAVLIWLALSLKRQLAAAKEQFTAVYAETGRLLAAHQAESKATIESAKSSFVAIRTEVRGLLEDHRRELAAILEAHRAAMQAGIDKINAEALQGAAARSIQACLRLEKAIGVLQQLFLETESRSTHEYGAEEFAPEESTFGAPPSGFGLSPTAALDQQAQTEEQALLTESPAEV
jgi:molybdenum cofactor biosynthesis enzyme MoaA